MYITAAALALLRIFVKSIDINTIVILVIIGALTGLAAAISGNAVASQLQSQPLLQDALDRHIFFANLLTWIGLTSALVLLYMHLKQKISLSLLGLILFVLVILSLITGFRGGVLVREFGVGTQFLMIHQEIDPSHPTDDLAS